MSKSYKDEQKEVKIMDLKNYSTGVQHIGIPTNDIDKTVEFYHKLGFETAFETVNEEANEKVVFLKLGTLVVETYENHAAKMEHGAIDHVALDVRDIEEIFRYINEAGLNSTQDTIHFLPFWENGVKFFTIEGPNKEKVEFSQYPHTLARYAEIGRSVGLTGKNDSEVFEKLLQKLQELMDTDTVGRYPS